jgi:mono/diheme cytochrome c family protein
MLFRLMRRPLLLLALIALAAGVVACGSQGIQLASSSPDYQGARIFAQRCAGCHTLKTAGTQGSAVVVNKREYKDGPNFNQRKEDYQGILYAIRNGGFSSGPMPQDIVVGKQAEQVARFVEKYSGSEASRPPAPSSKSAETSKPVGAGQ